MTVDNTQEVLDSRDVIARIEELKPWKVFRFTDPNDFLGEFDTEVECWQFIANEDYDPKRVGVGEDGDDYRELLMLTRLAEQGKDLEDWEYGVTLVRDSYFETYAEELANDIRAINSDASWPFTFIDWEAGADALKEDYEELDFSGVVYWAR